MERLANINGNYNEFLHRFLTVEKDKSPQEILEVFRTTTPQLSPQDFLARLPGGGTAIQFFDDSPEKDQRKALCTFEFSDEFANKKQEEACGVYFSANCFEKYRRKDNLKLIRSLFLDWDCAKQGDAILQEEIDAQKVKMLRRLLLLEGTFLPHVIIDTPHGLHCLWLINEDCRSFKLPEWEAYQNNLVLYFGGDIGAKDVTRVLRLPPYAHLKDPEKPYPIRFLYHDLS
ncbi:hypothetical protein COU76_04740 [Candidatus Peregrinibacteria bacterium CG10_big_fil_rev_8_21_14_0_10_49_10]|nr:MAG: hypothetical protein COU76_04740 [Candidatus Peregrinibacteria bacterium CG10_big_fil_rev_8_21_14_0_10_49_10]